MVIQAGQAIDLSVDQGVPFTLAVPTGDDPTDWTCHMQVRDRPGGLIFADLTVDSGLSIDVAHRRIDVALSADQIALFPLVAVYDLMVTPPAGTATLLARGNVYLTPSVTR